MNMEKFDDIMLDIECLGKTRNFAVTQIALVPFNLFGNISESPLYIKFDIHDLIAEGFTMDDSTVRWWIKENVIGFADQFKGRVPLSKGAKRITNFFKSIKPKRVWASADLDWQGLKNIYENRDLVSPVDYTKRLNTRTIKQMALYLGCEPFEKPIVTHNPVQDCIDQIHELNYYMSYLKNKDVKIDEV